MVGGPDRPSIGELTAVRAASHTLKRRLDTIPSHHRSRGRGSLRGAPIAQCDSVSTAAGRAGMRQLQRQRHLRLGHPPQRRAQGRAPQRHGLGRLRPCRPLAGARTANRPGVVATPFREAATGACRSAPTLGEPGFHRVTGSHRLAPRRRGYRSVPGPRHSRRPLPRSASSSEWLGRGCRPRGTRDALRAEASASRCPQAPPSLAQASRNRCVGSLSTVHPHAVWQPGRPLAFAARRSLDCTDRQAYVPGRGGVEFRRGCVLI